MPPRKENPPTKPSEFVPPTDHKALVAWLDKKREAGRKQLPDFQMKLNLAFVRGHQWVVWDSSSKTLSQARRDPTNPNAPIRIKANKIGGITERFIARLTKAAPEPQVRPVSDEEDDINAAKAASRILTSEFNRLGWEGFLIEHYFWVVTHGFAFAEILWDQEDGSVIGSIEDDEVRSGNIKFDSVPGFELAVDPAAKDMLSAKWCVRTKSLTKEAVWEHYGVTLADGESALSIAEEIDLLVDGPGGSKHTESVPVHQFWMVPCRAAPEGLVVTWSGTTILAEPTKFPYSHRRLPYVEFDLLPGLGKRQGRTWVDDLISLQTDYNDARSREAGIRRTLTPKLVAPAGAVDPQSVNSRVEVIAYNQVGEAPRWMIPDSGWMGQYETSMNRADMEMGDRAGQSDVSSGRASSPSMPAAAILALQEADDTKMSITHKLMGRGIEQAAWQVLELVKQFWTEERLVATYSETGALEVAHFSKADIDGQLDVHVSTESGIVRSKSAMVQLTMDLQKAGVLTDPRHILRLIQMPGMDFITEAFNVDARQAQRENEYLQLGEEVQVNTFDNHMVHITEHDNFRKSSEYDKLRRRAEAGDQEAVAVVANTDAHAMAHNELVMQQAGMGMQAPPGQMPQAPGGDGSGSVAKLAGIGGPGQPGAVPGVDVDAQAARMGA